MAHWTKLSVLWTESALPESTSHTMQEASNDADSSAVESADQATSDTFMACFSKRFSCVSSAVEEVGQECAGKDMGRERACEEMGRGAWVRTWGGARG